MWTLLLLFAFLYPNAIINTIDMLVQFLLPVTDTLDEQTENHRGRVIDALAITQTDRHLILFGKISTRKTIVGNFLWLCNVCLFWFGQKHFTLTYLRCSKPENKASLKYLNLANKNWIFSSVLTDAVVNLWDKFPTFSTVKLRKFLKSLLLEEETLAIEFILKGFNWWW